MNINYLKFTIMKSLKIWIAGAAAVLLANVFGLDFPVSASVVAMLSVAPTKKETLNTAVNRFYAFTVALIVSYFIYQIFDFTILAFVIYLLIYILVCNFAKWQNSITVNSVLISHFLTYQNITRETLTNEVSLFLIGAGIAVIINSHLHKKTEYMKKLKSETDEQIKVILKKMSEKIANNQIDDYTEESFEKLRVSVSNAKKTAKENYMNQILNAEMVDIEYIHMREQQIKVLHLIHKYIIKIKTITNTTNHVASYLKKISEVFSEDNSGAELMQELHMLKDNFSNTELPQTREEFEDRAILYLVMHHIEEIIMLKSDFFKKHYSELKDLK